jgi:hypothetical protein
MLSINLVILNILILINTELSLFFLTFQKSQESLQDNLKKIKNEALIPLLDKIKNHNSNNFQLYEYPIQSIEDIIDESELIFLGQRNLLNKIKRILKFISFMEYYHMRSMNKIDKLINDTGVKINEIRSSIEGYKKYISFKDQSLSIRFILQT